MCGQNQHKWFLLALVLIVVPITLFIGCNSISEEDRIVVECAEQMLWDFSYIADPSLPPETSHIDFLFTLIDDDIFLFKDEHPFKNIRNYLSFKADYYRDFFDWGLLPPENVMKSAGITPP